MMLTIFVIVAFTFFSLNAKPHHEKLKHFSDFYSQGYDLPLLPNFLTDYRKVSLEELGNTFPEYSKRKMFVPKNIFIAVKNASDELPGHLSTFFEKNKDWKVNVCDNACKDDFMNSTFAMTSISWAYNMISPSLGAAKADIWRYSILYTYGGLYLDDDSDIRTPLNEIVQEDDTMILSEEGSSSLGECYVPSFHLNEEKSIQTYLHNYSQAIYYHGEPYDGKNVPESLNFFHGHTLLNWAIFTAPRHPVLLRTLMNIVEIIKLEYLRRSVLHITRWDVRFKPFFCSTTFALTYSFREMLLQNDASLLDMQAPLYVATDIVTERSYATVASSTTNNGTFYRYLPRIVANNFHIYGGRVKAIWTGADSSHYSKVTKKNNALLSDYAPWSLELAIEHLEGTSVMGDTGREIFLVQNHSRWTFPDFETFTKMKLSLKKVRHVKNSVLLAIPIGGVLPSLVGVKDSDLTALTNVPPPVVGNPRSNPLIQEVEASKPTLSPTGFVSHSPTRSPTLAYNQLDSSLISNLDMQKLSQRVLGYQEFFKNSSYPCFGDDYAGTRDDFINGQWKSILGDDAVLVYPFCMRTFQLGNTLGYFLNDLACADVSGSHFLAIHKQVSIQNKNLLIGHQRGLPEDALYAFFQALPDLRIHSSPQPPEVAKKLMKEKCDCLQYCWENKKAPWTQRVPLLASIVHQGIQNYLGVSHVNIYQDSFPMDLTESSEHLLFIPNPDYLQLLINHRISLAQHALKLIGRDATSTASWTTQAKESWKVLQYFYQQLNIKGLFTSSSSSTFSSSSAATTSADAASLYPIEAPFFVFQDSEKSSLQALFDNPMTWKRVKHGSKSSVSEAANQRHSLSSSTKNGNGDAKTNLLWLDSHQTALQLPFLPRVVIQYRCGDNVGFGKTRYGLLPFRTYLRRIVASFQSQFDLSRSMAGMSMSTQQRLRIEEIWQGIYRSKSSNVSSTTTINQDASSSNNNNNNNNINNHQDHWKLLLPFEIHIIADPPSRSPFHPYSQRCSVILEKLVAYLHPYFPLATIAVYRGGDMFLDWAKLAYANVTFCSASTFCLWPSLVNQQHVYYPLTPLIAGSSSMESAVSIHSHFHWIDDFDMIKDFRQFRPWTRVYDQLEA